MLGRRFPVMLRGMRRGVHLVLAQVAEAALAVSGAVGAG